MTDPILMKMSLLHALLTFLSIFLINFFLFRRKGGKLLQRIQKERAQLQETYEHLISSYENLEKSYGKRTEELMQQIDEKKKLFLNDFEERKKIFEKELKQIHLMKSQFESLLDHVNQQKKSLKELENQKFQNTESSEKKDRYHSALHSLKNQEQRNSIQKKLGLTEDEMMFLKYQSKRKEKSSSHH